MLNKSVVLVTIPSKGQEQKNKGLRMCFTAALLWSSAITAKLSAIDLLLRCALGALFSVWTCTSFEITGWFSCGWVSPWLGRSPTTVQSTLLRHVTFSTKSETVVHFNWNSIELFPLLLSLFYFTSALFIHDLSVWCLDFILPFGEAPKQCLQSTAVVWSHRLQVQHQKYQIHTWSRD